MAEISGLLLFLRYAWPCADEKLRTGKITLEDYERLKLFVENNMQPDLALMEYCFLTAFREYCETCTKLNIDANLSFESVSKHWRYHHNHEGNCAVKMLTVVGINGQMVATGLAKPFVNFYDLQLEIVDTISVHRGVVIEKIELL